MIKILVVDDDEDFTKIYKTSLHMRGFDTTAVNQSSVAIEMAYLVKPDIFLIDLMMPEINGFQLCKLIRKDPVFQGAPIVIITALTDEESKKVAMDAGANDYLTKPFHIDDLKASILALVSE